jgi:hypothetical protein
MDVLYSIYTASEASAIWGKHMTTIKAACVGSRKSYKPALVARQTPRGEWLITKDSLIARWGLPRH